MSDRELRAYQRLVQANPDDIGVLKRYVAILERMTSARDDGKGAQPLPVETDFLQRHFDLAMAENGIITSLSQLNQITTLEQLETLTRFLFPADGGIEEFNSVNYDYAEDEMPEHDFLRVSTGIHAYREIHPILENYFHGYGYLEHIEKDAEIIWCAPFDSADDDWWKDFEPTVKPVWVEETIPDGPYGPQIRRHIGNQEEIDAEYQTRWGGRVAYNQARHQAWRNQGIVCWVGSQSRIG